MEINTPKATAILLIVCAVLTGISAAIRTVDVTQIPAELQPIWLLIVYIFTTSAAAPLFTFLRNFYGYMENKYETKPEERSTIHYEASQLWGTWLKYEGYIKAFNIFIVAFTQGTPIEPYAVYIAGTLAFVVDLIRKSISDLKA